MFFLKCNLFDDWCPIVTVDSLLETDHIYTWQQKSLGAWRDGDFGFESSSSTPILVDEQQRKNISNIRIALSCLESEPQYFLQRGHSYVHQD